MDGRTIRRRAPAGKRPDTIRTSGGTKRGHAGARCGRRRTQAAARAVHAAGYAGLRWWSALTGERHGLMLFLDRVAPDALRYGVPEPLTLRTLALREVARTLGIRVR